MRMNCYIKRVMAFFLSLIMVTSFIRLFPTSIQANAVEPTEIVTDGIYRIEFGCSGKVLDVTNESVKNGTQLQIWDEYEGHSNQLFRLEKIGEAWKITVLHSNKVIEVRDSSSEDYAHVSQWDDANITCQRWIIERDGDYWRFKNANSGQYMTVYNAYNCVENGSKVIQRPKLSGDNKIEQQFRIWKKGEDISYACWTRDLSINDIKWKEYSIIVSAMQKGNRGYQNLTFMNIPIKPSGTGWDWDKRYEPQTGQWILCRIEYYGHDEALDLISAEAYKKTENKNTREELKKYLFQQANEKTIEEIINKFVSECCSSLLKSVPLGEIINFAGGLCETIMSNTVNDPAHDDWNNFVTCFKENNKNGKRSGVIKKSYIQFVDYSESSAKNWYDYDVNSLNINYGTKAIIRYEVEPWLNNSIDINPPYNGRWNYSFSGKTYTYTLTTHVGNSPNYVYTVNDKIQNNPSNYVTSNLNYSNGVYEVSVNSSLNVRSGPGTGYSKIGSLSNGKQVEVVAISSGNWGKINYNGKTGWICLQYAKYKGVSSNSNGSSGGTVSLWNTSSAGDYCVNVNSHLNVRPYANTNSNIIGKLNNGDIIHVIETTTNSDGSIWAHISYNGMNAYCCMKSSGGTYYLSQKISPSKPYVNATGGTSQSDSYFSWNNCSNAKSYDIRIYNSSGTIVNSKMGLTSTSYQTKLPAGNYQVDVASVYNSDSYTFSDRVSFTVNKVTPDKPVVNVSPGNDLSDTCISWNSCKYADYYDVNIYKSNGAKYKTISNITSTSFKGNLSDIADYYVIVTAKNKTDGTSNSSDRKNFTVVSAVPSKPTLSLIPGNNHTNTTFTWNVCENANTYTLDVINTDTGEKVLSKSMTGTNYEMILSVPGNYSAQVTSVYTKGGTTNKSDIVKFYVEDVDVKPFSVSVAGVSDTIVSLEWTESLHATQYDIYRYSEGKYSLVGSTSELSYVDTGLYIGTEYKYYVHSSNEWTDIKSDNEVTAETILLYLNGSGSEESPYLISSEDDWLIFTDLINNKKTNKMFASSYYKQTVDINFESAITPVGTTETPFNGFYNGNYCSITGMNVNTKTNNLGLFGCCNNANISNLTVHGKITSSNSNIGGIAGKIGLGGKIENCAFYGNITGTNNIGGIVGYIENGGSIIRCYHVGNVSGEISGGIVGKARVGFYTISTDINISSSYHSGGNVTGTYSGGITGFEESGSIKKCSISYSDCFYLKGSAASPISGKTNAGILTASDAVFQNLVDSLGAPYTDGGASNNHYPVFKWEADLYQFKGQGTSSSPYLIETAEDLIHMSQYVNDKYLNTKYGNAFYLQISDIDLANADFVPIGKEESPFNSKYNGGYHSITGMSVSGDNVGLFGYVQNAKIENLIVNGKVSGTKIAGGFVGYSSESIEIYQCAFNGDINSKISGGLIGQANCTAKISSCYHNGNVTGSISGGLIGQFDNGISESANSLSLISSYHGNGTVTNGAIGSLLADESAIFAENVYYLKATANTSGYAQVVNETVLKNLAVTLDEPFTHGNINNGYPVFEWQIEKYSFEGNGTSDSPYIISSSDDLIALQRYVNDPSYNSIYGSAYYQQANDIDLGDREWEAIGINEQYSFNGVYDGNFCTIYGLNAYGDKYSGLFGQVGATSGSRKAGVYNLIIKYGTSCSATGVTGGTAAVLINGATVDHCSVIGDLSGGEGVGGLVGIVRKSASVLNSYHNGSVIGQRYVGGLVGYVESGTLRIENCYHTSGEVFSEQNYGAIVGYSKGTSNIINCFYLNGSCDYAINGTSNSGALSVNSMVLQNLSITLGDAYIDNFTEYNDGYPIFASQYDIDSPFVSGDVNSDGYFDITDIKMLQDWLLGSGILNDWRAGDLCEDGIIDVFDLVMMKRLYIN